MPIEQKTLAGTCEITTGAFTPTTSMPTFQGENNAVRMEITFFNDGAAYNIPSGVDVRAHLYYAARPAMTQSLQMEVVGNLATLDVSDLFTAVSGTPLMVVRLIDSNGDIQVSCAFGVNVKPTLSGTVIYLLPPSPDEIIYVGRSPYVGNNGNWWTFDNDLHVFVDSGYAATGNYYVFAKWSASAPTQDSDMQDTPADWIGWYTGPAMTAPAHYTDYVWFLQKGATGAAGVSGTNGADGDDGVGIVSVAKTSTVGLVDTYTITYTDATTSTFTVTNGADGEAGAQGESGAAGQGVPTGGTVGQALIKSSATDYVTGWGNTTLQYSTMPTPAIGNLGWIVTFIGTTDANYTHGHVYECVSSGGGSPTYSWIGLTASNPNLGINCDWRTPVNQRASTGAVTNAYCIDFWIGNGTVTPSAGNYITLTNGTTMIQRMEILSAKLLSAVVTASIEIGGTVQSTTLSFPSTTAGSAVSRALTGATFEVGFVDLGNGVTKTLQGVASRYIPYLKITATAAINVTRIKLELGGLSTLMRDIPRNYAADLAMCQRYYEPIPSRFNPGYYSAANNTSINIATSVNMRDTPTIAVTVYDGIFDRAGSYITLTGLTAVALNACGVLIAPTFASAPAVGIIMMINTAYSLDAGLL